MNKWVARSETNFVEVKDFEGKDGRHFQSVGWTMFTTNGGGKSYYNCKSYNKSIIENLRDNMEIELLDYEIKVNNYTDKNTMQKKIFTYFQVKQIKIHSVNINNDAVIYDTPTINMNNQQVNMDNQQVNIETGEMIEDEIVDLEWAKEYETLKEDNLKKLEDFKQQEAEDYLDSHSQQIESDSIEEKVISGFTVEDDIE